jgi:hypothetical protein
MTNLKRAASVSSGRNGAPTLRLSVCGMRCHDHRRGEDVKSMPPLHGRYETRGAGLAVPLRFSNIKKGPSPPRAASDMRCRMQRQMV